VRETYISLAFLHGSRVYASRVTELELRAKLIALIDQTVDQMLELDTIEPGSLSLIAGASAAIDVLERRQQPKEPE
jgi:hypothetical protein